MASDGNLTAVIDEAGMLSTDEPCIEVIAPHPVASFDRSPLVDPPVDPAIATAADVEATGDRVEGDTVKRG